MIEFHEIAVFMRVSEGKIILMIEIIMKPLYGIY